MLLADNTANIDWIKPNWTKTYLQTFVFNDEQNTLKLLNILKKFPYKQQYLHRAEVTD